MRLQDFDFRIWDKDIERFVHNDDCEIELWTGYADTKGTRIYEKDIIRTDKGEIFSVVADGEITAWTLLENGRPCCSLAEVMFESEKVEVVGNIHENAELLKDKE